MSLIVIHAVSLHILLTLITKGSIILLVLEATKN
jgi:hypothetical protein